jgi:RNA-directed DNA polymerase
MIKKHRRNRHAGRAQQWAEGWFNGHGLFRLPGTI